MEICIAICGNFRAFLWKLCKEAKATPAQESANGEGVEKDSPVLHAVSILATNILLATWHHLLNLFGELMWGCFSSLLSPGRRVSRFNFEQQGGQDRNSQSM